MASRRSDERADMTSLSSDERRERTSPRSEPRSDDRADMTSLVRSSSNDVLGGALREALIDDTFADDVVTCFRGAGFFRFLLLDFWETFCAAAGDVDAAAAGAG